MKKYLDMLQHVLDTGEQKEDRTGTGTISVFGYQTRFNLEDGFPLLTTKKVHFKSVVHELLWFLKGSTNVEYLQKNDVKIWNEWADDTGELGPIYGKQWRSWQGKQKNVDQIENLIEQLKTNPNSRRHILSAWNVGDLEDMALVPCHAFVQFYVDSKERLSCHLYQRSADTFLGVPFNIASYSLLTHMIAQVTGYKVGEFIHTFGDLHIYNNHLEQVKLQLTREPKELPQLKLNPQITNINDFEYQDIELINYEPHPAIKGVVSV